MAAVGVARNFSVNFSAMPIYVRVRFVMNFGRDYLVTLVRRADGCVKVFCPFPPNVTEYLVLRLVCLFMCIRIKALLDLRYRVGKLPYVYSRFWVRVKVIMPVETGCPQTG